ncbi:GDSL-type esterase/lipase family protein [Gordonia sp. (in: high G+C Gram-positive bacteria)]|uniref:GDSL-type esterase/lipase family protein n=1 Tax=Gordonia sp. (in: high G+C Gram-positive bacteria) TaxID=84139 RepID=UPI002613DCEC|nr:GDSL-type esterase/lipase family protein [Gordonia sp. (in: high G+C Gram-positive bacteria)]
MTTETILRRPRPARRRARRTAAVRTAALLAGLTVAASSAAALPARASAAPADELMGVAGQILQALPETSNSSADLPSLFTLLIPQVPQPGTPRSLPTGDRTTSCTEVTHIGDSTSVGIDDPAKFTDPADRLSSQYQRVGVKNTVLDAAGGRSIVETVNGEPNAVQVIQSQLAKGRTGCWVIAMGVNDAADIAVGSTVDADQRIDRVMNLLKGQQVLWPTVATAAPSNPAYADTHMREFDAALTRAAARYPNLRIYDFAAETQPSWYVDGIHYNADGLAQRNRLFATALATAFPAAAAPPKALTGR